MNRLIKHAWLALVIIPFIACNASKQSRLDNHKNSHIQQVDSLPATIISPKNEKSILLTDTTSKIDFVLPELFSANKKNKTLETPEINSDQENIFEIQGLHHIGFRELKIVIGDNRNINYLNHDF